jgi:HD-GYP domain-containing protein (c-di-GMP phosphodiesterase class II)/GGDEF domain-containing protein
VTVALLATVAGRQARRAGERAVELRRARDEVELQRAAQERLRAELRRTEDSLRRQREVLHRLAESRRLEREWNRELRMQLQRLYEAPHRRPGRRDVSALILQAAIELVGAEKGMLLSREDADEDGALDVTVAEGFDEDPETSVVAQRFARRVLALDEILRDDAPTAGLTGLSAADQEIETLVAIPVYLHDRFRGVIVCVNRPGGFEDVDDDVLLALGDQAGAVLHHDQLRTEIRETHHGAIRALLEALGARDPERQRRTTALTLNADTLATDLGFDDHEQDVLVCAALLRDAGYLALRDGVLAEPRPLRPDERAAIELHPRFGFNVIGQLPALHDVAATVLYHHERYDGLGYPNGLSRESIPRTARALAALEAYDAMTSDRPYRPALSSEDACAELVAEAGTQFDPEIVQVFVERIRRDEPSLPETVHPTVADALPHDVIGELDSFAGPLTVTSTDGLTLLGNRRAFEQDLMNAVGPTPGGDPVALLLIQLQDLPRVNEEAGFDAGDHLIQLAARNAQRAAARCGGRAYRASGRRLGILAPRSRPGTAADPAVHVEAEFVAGPAIRITCCEVQPGEHASAVVERARRKLVGDA